MRIFTFILAFFMALPVAACTTEETVLPPATSAAPPTTETQEVAAEDYICPMHPEIRGKEGDTCRICHMPLEPEKSATPAQE